MPTIFPYTDSPVKHELHNDVVRFEKRQAVKRGRVEVTQISNRIQNSESNVSSDVMCTASEYGSYGNNCEQSEDATTNIEI